MIVKATALGLLLWAVEFLALRLFGHLIFTPERAPHVLTFAAAAAFGALVMYVAMHVLRGVHGDEAEGAAALALPGGALGAAAVNFYPVLFPNLDPVLDGVLAVHILLQILAILGVGLFFTRLAPEDERI